MMKKKHLFCIVLLFSTASSQKAIGEDEPYQGPILETTKLEIIYSDAGVLKANIHAAKVLQYQNGDMRCPNGIDVILYDADKNITATIKANDTFYFAEKNICELKGDVTIKSGHEDKQLTTEKLYWNTSTETLYTDQFITIKNNGEILMGDGLEATQDLTRYHILKPQGFFNVKPIQ